MHPRSFFDPAPLIPALLKKPELEEAPTLCQVTNTSRFLNKLLFSTMKEDKKKKEAQEAKSKALLSLSKALTKDEKRSSQFKV